MFLFDNQAYKLDHLLFDIFQVHVQLLLLLSSA